MLFVLLVLILLTVTSGCATTHDVPLPPPTHVLAEPSLSIAPLLLGQVDDEEAPDPDADATPPTTPRRILREFYKVPTIYWNPPTLDSDGGTLQDLAGYAIRIVPEGESLEEPSAMLERRVEDPHADHLVDHTIALMLPSIRHDVWVAAYDHSGNLATFAKSDRPLDLRDLPPAPVTGVRVELKIVQETTVRD